MWQEAYTYPVLQQDWKGKEVYLAGVLSDVCVKQAMDGFLSRGAKVTLLEDLCQGLKNKCRKSFQELSMTLLSGADCCGILRQRSFSEESS